MKIKISVILFCLMLFSLGIANAGPYTITQDGINGLVGGNINPVFKAWATGYQNYNPAPGVATQWQNPAKALGPVYTDNNGDIVSLGDLNQIQIDAWKSDPINNSGPGEITLTFNNSIFNGSGYDFAVFENGFFSGPGFFAELGYVDVSTDGNNFARFNSVSLTSGLVGGYGTLDPTDVHNLAGKHALGVGTGFDLDDLTGNTLVLSGLVDLNNINYVKITDIPGSGDFFDSEGNSIYDAWPTWGSGGFDLESVGVINAVPVPAAVWLLLSGLIGLIGMRRKTQTV